MKKSRFLLHALNNKATSVLGHVELINEKTLSIENREYLTIAKKCLIEMRNLIIEINNEYIKLPKSTD